MIHQIKPIQHQIKIKAIKPSTNLPLKNEKT